MDHSHGKEERIGLNATSHDYRGYGRRGSNQGTATELAHNAAGIKFLNQCKNFGCAFGYGN
jgi:hypothetical protein